MAATASYLDARANRQPWLLRIDDIDPQRTVAGATDAIQRALEDHALHWDGSVILQSQRLEHYRDALQTLTRLGLVFYCICSRRQLQGHRIYPGTCRWRSTPSTDSAVRVRVDDACIEFTDLIQGPQHTQLASSTGDFVVRRRDGLIAYQLATAVDDGEGLIDSVVRGADLLSNTPRQIYLMGLLGLTPPAYAHVPVLVDSDGRKLSKQTFASPLDARQAADNLVRTFTWLGLSPPAEAHRWPCAELVDWGVKAWRLDKVPRVPYVTL